MHCKTLVLLAQPCRCVLYSFAKALDAEQMSACVMCRKGSDLELPSVIAGALRVLRGAL